MVSRCLARCTSRKCFAERRLAVRLWFLRLAEPGVQVGHPLRCDAVPLAIGARSGLDANDLDQAIPLELGQRAVDLAEPDRLDLAEPPVVRPLQVVSVSAGSLEQTEERVGDGHGRTIHAGYTRCK
jgi:hypothetical protein